MYASVAASHKGDISGAAMDGITRAGDEFDIAQISCALPIRLTRAAVLSDIIGYLWVDYWVSWLSLAVMGIFGYRYGYAP
jgi:hypothetical protein